jgi:hypothetical protein
MRWLLMLWRAGDSRVLAEADDWLSRSCSEGSAHQTKMTTQSAAGTSRLKLKDCEAAFI